MKLAGALAPTPRLPAFCGSAVTTCTPGSVELAALSLTPVSGASPSPWTCTSNQLEVTAGGADVWGTSDQFTYVYASHSGDFDVKVSVTSLPYVGSTWSKVGPSATVASLIPYTTRA